MRFDLPALARRATNPRRQSVTLRDIIPPAILATDLYRACYAPTIALITRTADRVIAEYERTLSALTTDAPTDVNAILDDADRELTRLFYQLRPAMRDWVLRVERYHRGKWRGAVLAASKVDLSTLIGPEDVAETLDQILAWNVELVADVNRQARQRISSAVFDGLRARSPARDAAKVIREATGMARRRSIAIASDQLSKLTGSLASERRRQAGLTQWQWASSHKLHFRPEHAARDGKIYTDETAPKDLPSQLPFCGCRERAVISFE